MKMKKKDIVSSIESLTSRVNELEDYKRDSRMLIRLLINVGIIDDSNIDKDGHLKTRISIKTDVATLIEHLDTDNKKIIKALNDAGVINITRMNGLLMAAINRFDIEPATNFCEEINALHKYLGVEYKNVPKSKKLVVKKQPKKKATTGDK